MEREAKIIKRKKSGEVVEIKRTINEQDSELQEEQHEETSEIKATKEKSSRGRKKGKKKAAVRIIEVDKKDKEEKQEKKLKKVSVPKGSKKKKTTKAASSKHNLIIVESPTKAKTIKKYLGPGHEVVASNGHIKDLPKSKLGVDVENDFQADIAPISGKKTVIERLHKYAERATDIYLATDPDREGEAIAFHIAEEISSPENVHRVLINAVTKPAVLKAVSSPSKLNVLKYNSQKTRRILDRLVGYKISPLLWDKVQRGLSAGRVQSVALRLIVLRDQEIKEHKPQQWFTIETTLEKEDKKFGSYYYGESKDKKNDLSSKEVVDKILDDIKDQDFQVVEVKMRERKQNPTPPFTTSKIQQEAATKLGFSVKKTMMVAQKLYEGIDIKGHGLSGLITYMRTDSVRVEGMIIDEVRKYILSNYGYDYLPPEAVIYKKKGRQKIQDAHEAIRPTNFEFPPKKIKGDLSDDEFKLYELVWNKFISSQMVPAVIIQTRVVYQVQNHFFKSKGSIVKFDGQRKVYLDSKMESGKGGNGLNVILPNIDNGETFRPINPCESIEHWTSPPPRYNDASIVKDLEEKGIGRPSTYASIISNIVDRGYVEKIEKRYMATELGAIVSKMLIESFPNEMDVEFTARIEDQLDGIEEGDIEWTRVLKDFWDPFEKSLEKAKEEMKNLKKTQIPTGLTCIKCGKGEYLIKWGRNGQFVTCSFYPTCTSTEDFKKHLDGSIEIIPKEFTGEKCPTCQKRLVVKKGRYGRFLACEEYPNCKTTLPYTLDIDCPECKVGKFAEKRSRFGKFFYGCSNYPNCQNAMWTLPQAYTCPNCDFPVMGQRETKKQGVHLQCPKCQHRVPIEETPFKVKDES